MSCEFELELGVGSWELEVGSWELGVGSCEWGGRSWEWGVASLSGEGFVGFGVLVVCVGGGVLGVGFWDFLGGGGCWEWGVGSGEWGVGSGEGTVYAKSVDCVLLKARQGLNINSPRQRRGDE